MLGSSDSFWRQFLTCAGFSLTATISHGTLYLVQGFVGNTLCYLLEVCIDEILIFIIQGTLFCLLLLCVESVS